MSLSAAAWAGIAGGSVITIAGLKYYFNGGVNKHWPDLSGKTIIITGANVGLGFISAVEMSKLKPSKIIMACRSEKRATDAIRDIQKQVPDAPLEWIPLDLNDLASVKQFATTFNSKYDKIDILLNNAGIMALPERETTAQGYEKQIGVNHLGHYLLTTLLMDKIKAAPQSRIINVSSLAHTMGDNRLNFDDLMCEQKYVPWDAYMQSKLSNVYFTRQLAENLEAENCQTVKVCSLHPGVVRTELGRYMYDGKPIKKFCTYFFGAPLFYLMTKNQYAGTQTSLHCCLMPFDAIENGAYYADCKIKKETFKPDWKDQKQKLWDWSVECTKDYTN